MMRVLLLSLAAFTGCECGGAPPGVDGGPPPGAVLHVNKVGDGEGSLFSNPQGIDCDVACAEQTFAFGEEVNTVTLSAEPGRNANFLKWTCTGAKDGEPRAPIDTVEPNVVPFDDVAPGGLDITCTAELRKVTTLLVVFSGDGAGHVTGTLPDEAGGAAPRVDCPTDCVGAYFVEESDTLTAVADPGSTFVGWQLDCDGTGPVTLQMAQDKNCEAVFEPQ